MNGGRRKWNSIFSIMSKKYKDFTEHTWLVRVMHCKQFKAFKDYVLNPYPFRRMMQLYTLKGLKLFYPFNTKFAAYTLNQMRRKVDEETLEYHPLQNKNVGYFSFLVGENKPFVLVFPGGGYGDVASLVEGFPIAIRLNQLGYNAFVGLYRIGKRAHIPNPQDDAAAILKDILANSESYKIDVKDYAICGCSAGGHLAATMCTKTVGFSNYGLPTPKTAMLVYPVITMGEFTHAGSRKALLGKDGWENEGLRKKYSVELHVDKDFPETFMWQCKDDKVVPVQNSRMMAEALKRNGVRFEYIPVEGNAHGWGLAVGEAADGWLEKAVEFWQE